VPEPASNPDPRLEPRPRRATLVAAGLLLAALALVVIYTTRGAFFSPLALVVVAAIGLAALLLQLRLRPASSSAQNAVRGPLWLNAVGVLSAFVALLADSIHLNPAVMLILALVAVVSFAVSGVIVLSGLRKRRA
jgi:hypothetical protein